MIQLSTALRVAQELVLQREGLNLPGRDLALLVLLYEELRGRSVPGYSVDMETLRDLSRKVDLLDGAHPAAVERRLTESIGRLLDADCLNRSDMARLRDSEEATYQLTVLGENLAEWHVSQTRFDGAPLGMVLKAFNVQLAALHGSAKEAASSPEQWRAQVVGPLQHVARELLSAVQRHQRSLDRAHNDIRNFIPGLLKQSSEQSIEECKRVIDTAMDTIRDLVHVTVDVSNAAFGFIDAIEDVGSSAGHEAASSVCEDIRRRLETIVEWTNQRHHDWAVHFETVHAYLRFVSMVDRSRRVTDALKRAVSEVPRWSMEVAAEPSMFVLREAAGDAAPRAPLRTRRTDYRPEIEVIQPEQLSAFIHRRIDEQLAARGQVAWTSVVRELIGDGHPDARVIGRLPEMMSYIVHCGTLGADRERQLVGGFEVEELEVRRRPA